MLLFVRAYPDISAALRTDEQFGRQGYQQHQLSASPLNDLGIGLVTSFVLDYMHLVCLGTMCKIIFLWLKGPLKCRQASKLFVAISAYMVSID